MFDVRDRFDGAVKTVACAAAAAAAGVASLFFFLVALFLWTQQHYGTIAATLVLAIVFLFAAMAALTIAWVVRQRSAERQQRVRKSSPQWWADPAIIAAALEVFKTIGSKRLIPVLLGAFVVGTLLSRSGGAPKPDDPQA
jgi:cytochrome c biogenesis protein CcdA